jgi:hypothetical protein
MWRKFIPWGVALLIGGMVVAIVAGSRTFSLEYESVSTSTAAAVFALLGWIVAIVGGMLLNAGLIGAAVGADRKSQLRDSDSARYPKPTSEWNDAQLAHDLDLLDVADDDAGWRTRTYDGSHPGGSARRREADARRRRVARCSNCGEAAPADAEFCGVCGAKIEGE